MTATDSQTFRLTVVQDLLESWGSKLWKDVFHPRFFFFFFWKISSNSYFTAILEAATVTKWVAKITNNILKPSVEDSCFLTLVLFAVCKDLVSSLYCLSAAVTISHSSAGDFFYYTHTHTHIACKLHKPSSTLKWIPMRHVTGSLCLAVCLLERCWLLK